MLIIYIKAKNRDVDGYFLCFEFSRSLETVYNSSSLSFPQVKLNIKAGTTTTETHPVTTWTHNFTPCIKPIKAK